MSDCKQFQVPLRYYDDREHGSRDGTAQVSYAFPGSSRDHGVMFTIKDNALNAAIHTTEASLVNLAHRILEELG
jgi:hypothetical protein